MAFIDKQYNKFTRNFPIIAVNIVLTGWERQRTLHICDRETIIKDIVIVYESDSAISNQGGVLLSLGTHSDKLKFAQWESEITASAGSVFRPFVNKNNKVMSRDDTVVLYKQLPKANAGTVSIKIELAELR